MAALKVLAPTLSGPAVDQRVVGALWGMAHRAFQWGVHPAGMLRRNGLIARDDVIRLERWIYCINEAATHLLGGGDLTGAFAEYDHLDEHESSSIFDPAP